MFKLSGFADEIHSDISKQIQGLQRLGMSYIEVRGVDGTNIADLDLEQARQLKSKLDAGGISVSAVGSPIGKVDINGDFESELKRFAHVLKISEILKAKYIRLFSFYIAQNEDKDSYKDKVISRMSEFVEMARGYDVILAHENERGIYGDFPHRNLELAKAFSGEKFGLVYDAGNFVCDGITPYPDAFDSLLPYIEYLHIKDADANGQFVPAGMGNGGFPETLARLKERGEDIFLSIEPHLQAFEGFGMIANSETAKLIEGSDGVEKGERLFTLAYQALKKLI